ncbi:substrate-binding periplasmic protein [Erythrobacter neustonensis]|uniref:ABC transporter substrate-binding protein n=1 Tax=Erythrobacter neustonensis TaxID=1112 RepID=A0A192D4E0_9SPHN|nr:transporter substrate-binding domain-containing protein [Erythrobacter neustonensis]ANK12639.1 ABC transporter substrate-binding protein [Erythrobacter neustonensis]
MAGTRRGFLAGVAGAGAALALGGPLGAAPLAKVRELGLLRVGLYADNRPWSWDKGGGVPAGIDVDLAMAIADQLGVKHEIALFTADEDLSDDLRNVVWRGGLLGFRRCDLMLHVPFDMQLSSREDQVVFVAPYYREEFTAVCSAQTRDCNMPPQRFVGSKVGAELDSIPDFYLMGSFGGVLRGDVEHYPTGHAAALAVHDGEIEMAVATRAQIEAATADRSGSAAKHRTSPLPLMPSSGWDIGMAVREDSRTLGFAVEDIVTNMAGDGRMAALFARHGVTWQAAAATKVL